MGAVYLFLWAGVLWDVAQGLRMDTSIAGVKHSNVGAHTQTHVDPDPVWTSMRRDAEIAIQKEPLLVSFLHSTILSQESLESALAFHMANKLASPAMIGTQIQGLFIQALQDRAFQESLRLDLLAVKERDPACRSLPEVLLYFKGFQALQAHRAAHCLWIKGRDTLAYFIQSQVSQVFQIDIHPAARLGSGLLIDHGTGIVIGETAVVGRNVSMLHHVTLGGSGKKSTIRHPHVGNGVVIGAGASLLGNIKVGDGAQIGACSLVLEDIPENCVAVGVPAKILGRARFSQPSLQVLQEAIVEDTNGPTVLNATSTA